MPACAGSRTSARASRAAPIYNFSRDNFRNNVRSQQYANAPAGFIYPGDPGFPGGLRGINTQWLNFSPRVGIGWDVAGDGRTAVRASYGLTYDFPNAEYQLINANSPPFGNRTIVEDPPGRFDRPYAHLGGDPHPILTNRDTVFIPYGAFGSTDPNLNSPRVQQWNVTIERQLGTVWQVAASYIGSYTDRLWNQVAINPGVFLGTRSLHAAGRVLPGLHDQRQSESAPRVLAVEREPGRGAAHRQPRRARRRRKAGLPRAEAVVPAARDESRAERQLHALALLGPSLVSDRRIPADCQRLHQPGGSRFRHRLLRSGPHTHRRPQRRRADAAVLEHRRCASRSPTGASAASSAPGRDRWSISSRARTACSAGYRTSASTRCSTIRTATRRRRTPG